MTAKWADGVECYPLPLWPVCSSFFWAGPLPDGPFIFIRQPDLISADMVVHETGHQYMHRATGYWTYWDTSCFYHTMFDPEDVNCAWTEGWGDFLALVVNNDACYDFGIGPYGVGTSENFELRNRNDNPPGYPWGDTVEGRVARALYDLWDAANEPDYDSATFGLDPIARITLEGYYVDNFWAFWLNWEASGYNKHQAARALYQNTIDYNTAPRFNPPLPDRTILENISWTHAIDLWDYTEDDESADAELSYQIYSPAQCGASLDSHWINFSPQTNWIGSCEVSVSVSDSIADLELDTFWVYVVPVSDRMYLPLILK